MKEFQPSVCETYQGDNGDIVKVYIQKDAHRHAWQLEVNGNKSLATSLYKHILFHNGWALATDYFVGTPVPAFVPFRLSVTARKVNVEKLR